MGAWDGGEGAGGGYEKTPAGILGMEMLCISTVSHGCQFPACDLDYSFATCHCWGKLSKRYTGLL